VARVALLSPDLLFGSKVEGALALAGHTVNRFATAERLRVAAQCHDVVIFDLTAEEVDGPGLLSSLRERGELEGVPTLGYYSHVDAEMRARALDAGFT
jgi:PleD family two-component response regulator